MKLKLRGGEDVTLQLLSHATLPKQGRDGQRSEQLLISYVIMPRPPTLANIQVKISPLFFPLPTTILNNAKQYKRSYKKRSYEVAHLGYP